MFSWIEIMRLSNAPTIVSNVLAGIAIGMLYRLGGFESRWDEARAAPWSTAFMLLAGAVLVYVAGMILNDAFDARVDATERPGRPIPSGRISHGTARAVGLIMLVGGTTLLACAGPLTAPWAILLGATVLLYDTLHRQIPLPWLLLALCRALVIVIAALAISQGTEWSLLGWVAGSLFMYVACFSIAAREEVRGLHEAARMAARVTPALTLLPLGVWFFDIPRDQPVLAVLSAGVLLVVAVPAAVLSTRQALRGRTGIPIAVGGWIGNIALLDAAVCLMVGRPWLGLACVGLWGLAGAMRPRIAAS